MVVYDSRILPFCFQMLQSPFLLFPDLLLVKFISLLTQLLSKEHSNAFAPFLAFDLFTTDRLPSFQINFRSIKSRLFVRGIRFLLLTRASDR